jgi:S-methylmethionine-dependent homocysteine/selenocysteine methylase
MAKYRNDLPLMGNDIYLTDGGLETTLVFHEGIDLPEFSAFVLLKNDEGRKTLVKYFQKYVSIAHEHEVGFILESPTWRASSKWGKLLGYSDDALEKLNREAIRLLSIVRDEYENDKAKIVISGCIGSKGDGYAIDEKMTVDEAEKYHASQIATFSHTEADLVSAFTLTYAEEAIGIVRAAQLVKMPVVIGFTVETDGKLPSGQSIEDAIETVDNATNNYTAYYMINCAHPTHFQGVLSGDESWKKRIRAVRANASAKSHAELDEAEELDDGNPLELGRQYKELRAQLNNLNIFGGCCGTDHRHVEAICKTIIA